MSPHSHALLASALFALVIGVVLVLPVSGACPPGTDFQTDVHNCGSCGNECGADASKNFVCTSGVCHCPAGYQRASSDEGDSDLCLKCPTYANAPAAQPDKDSCPCPPNQEWQDDIRQCVSCGENSSGGPGGYERCVCKNGFEYCPPNQCTDLRMDDNNCGACHVYCPVGSVCRKSKCVCWKYYYGDPYSAEGCRECDWTESTTIGSDGQKTCPCRAGYSNFDPSTGKCTPKSAPSSLSDGFSSSNSGSGGWQFGATDSKATDGGFVAFSSYGDTPLAPGGGVKCWTPQSGDIYPYACKTTGGSVQGTSNGDTFEFDSPPWINFHPATTSASKPKAVARFTVPADGKYNLIGTFDGDQRATADVSVFRSGKQLWSSALKLRPFGDGGTMWVPQDFTLTTKAKAGEHFDFVVGDLGSQSTQDWVKLKARVIADSSSSGGGGGELCNGKKCSKSKVCCANKCQDTLDSEDHCGTCGNKCPKKAKCCGGSCSTVEIDVNHCGSCGKKCKAGETCIKGKCKA